MQLAGVARSPLLEHAGRVVGGVAGVQAEAIGHPLIARETPRHRARLQHRHLHRRPEGVALGGRGCHVALELPLAGLELGIQPRRKISHVLLPQRVQCVQLNIGHGGASHIAVVNRVVAVVGTLPAAPVAEIAFDMRHRRLVDVGARSVDVGRDRDVTIGLVLQFSERAGPLVGALLDPVLEAPGCFVDCAGARQRGRVGIGIEAPVVDAVLERGLVVVAEGQRHAERVIVELVHVDAAKARRVLLRALDLGAQLVVKRIGLQRELALAVAERLHGLKINRRGDAAFGQLRRLRLVDRGARD